MATITGFRRQSPGASTAKWLLQELICFQRSRISPMLLMVMLAVVVWTIAIPVVDISVSGTSNTRTGVTSYLSASDAAQHRLPKSLRSPVAVTMMDANTVSTTSSQKNPAVSSPKISVLSSSTNRRGAREPQPVLRASDLPNASGWKATEKTPYEVCFVTSVYSASPDTSDRPPDITDIQQANPSFQFFAFTNMPNLDAPGWTVKVKDLSQYRRYITQSRWAKFMGWKDPDVHGCQAVFYMDGFCGPKLKHSERYKQLAKAIRDSEFGLFQNEHYIAEGPLDELDRILERHKDVAKNVEASKEWLIAQPDFRRDAVIYENHYIGYNPQSTIFQQAAEFFWGRYSLEQDSWRDQPLWSYVLDHFHILPTRLGTFDALFKEYFKRMGHAGHRYNAGADSNAVASKLA